METGDLFIRRKSFIVLFNDLQQKIYDAVSAVLGHSRFGIDTELYSAGLDSLGSVLLLTDLYEKLQLSMTLNDLPPASSG